MPDPHPGRVACIYTLSVAPGCALRQFRVLGCRPGPCVATARLPQPDDRSAGACARRTEVALLRLVLHRRRILGRVRSRGLPCAQGPLRSAGRAARFVRQVRGAGVKRLAAMIELAPVLTRLEIKPEWT